MASGLSSNRRTPSRVWILTTLLACAATPAACARLGGGPDNPFDQDRAPSQVRIIVINNDFNDATLFALGSGERRRLGVVTGKTEASYVIPWRLSGPLRIEINMLAAGSCTTPTIQVDPGDLLELQIQNEAVRIGECSGMRGRGES